MLRNLTGGAIALALTMTAPLCAQDISILVLQADALPGGGTVIDLLSVKVNDDGTWAAVLADQSVFAPAVVLRDDAVVYRNGMPVSGPGGGSYVALSAALGLNEAGDVTGPFSVTGSGPATAVIGYEGAAVLEEDEPVFAAGVHVGSAYEGFLASWSAVEGRFLVHAQLTAPGVGSHEALIDVTFDPSMGLLFEQLVVKSGDVLPGQTAAAVEFGDFFNYGQTADINRLGDVAFAVSLDHAVASSAVYLGDELIALEGQPSGVVPGDHWGELERAAIDLTEGGKLAFRGRLQVAGQAIVYDGHLVAKFGDAAPGVGPGATFSGISQTGPISVSESGEVLFVASWQGSSTGSGLFLGEQLLVHDGVSTTGGFTIAAVSTHRRALGMSPSGRYVIFLGTLTNTLEGAFLIDRGPRPLSFCAGDGFFEFGPGLVPCPCSNESDFGRGEGCKNSQGHGAYLGMRGSLQTAANDTVFTMHQVRPNQPGMLVQGSGIQALSFRDGLLCMGNPTERIEVVFTDSTGYGQTTSDISAEGNVLPGETRYYQYWYRDPDLSVCGTGSNLSQALKVQWQ